MNTSSHSDVTGIWPCIGRTNLFYLHFRIFLSCVCVVGALLDYRQAYQWPELVKRDWINIRIPLGQFGTIDYYAIRV